MTVKSCKNKEDYESKKYNNNNESKNRHLSTTKVKQKN